jgi:heat shock protein HslJ
MRSRILASMPSWLAATILSVTAAGCGGGQPPTATAPAAAPAPAATPTLEQLRTATISGVLEQAVTLANGRYEGAPVEAGAASVPVVVLWEPTFRTGDLDGAAGSEAVVLLGASGGGSGEFVHLAAFAVRDGQLVNLGTSPVGDRVRVQSVWLERGKVVMDVVEAGPADAACCPTQVARKTYALADGTLRQESSEVRGVLAISMLAANEWQLVSMDGQPLPAGVDPPLIHFERDSMRGFAGCNRFNASIKESQPGQVEVGPPAGTKMACPSPAMELEQAFLERIARTRSYTFLAGQLAFAWQDGERSGTLVFGK